MHRTHLPKLDRWGVVEYDSGRKTVRLAQGARSLNRCLGITTWFGIRWTGYYRRIATTGGLAILGAELGAPALSAAGTSLLSALLLVLIAVSTVLRLWPNRGLSLRE